MAAGYVIFALVGLLGLFFVAAMSMTWAARAVARLLAVPGFQWFDARPAPVAWWRRLLVRIGSMAAPIVVSITLFWLSLYTGGVPSVTGTHVEVQPGPALAAGLRTGDRVLRIGEQPIRAFDELRSAVQGSQGTTQIEVERDGQRLVLDVTPRAGRIGVSPLPRQEQVSPVAAAARAIPMPFAVVGKAAHALGRSDGDRSQLRGPVGIVRETSKAGQDSGSSYLLLLAILAGTWWPCAVAVALFDIVTGYIFRAAHADAASSALRGYRLERLRQAAMFTCAGYATSLFALGFDAAGVPYAKVLMVGALMTGVAGYPLIWLGGREIWGKPTAALLLLASLFVPCLLLFVVLALHFRLGRALKTEGFDVTWLSAQLPAQPTEPTRFET